MSVKISALTALAVAPDAADLVCLVDISDTTMAATGTDKKITIANLLASYLPLAGGTMTGALTISKNGDAISLSSGVGNSYVDIALLGSSNLGTVRLYAFDAGYGSSGEYQAGKTLLEVSGGMYLTSPFFRFYSGVVQFGTTGSVGVSENSSGVMEINNGTAGTFRDLKLRDLFSTGQVTIGGTSASSSAGQVSIGGVTRTTIGANGAASALTANPLGYLDVYIAGTACQIPYYNRGA